MSDSNTSSESAGASREIPLPDATLWTKRQIAKRYNVCARTVDSWTAKKVIPFLRFSPRLIRYPVAECDRALAERFKINAR